MARILRLAAVFAAALAVAAGTAAAGNGDGNNGNGQGNQPAPAAPAPAAPAPAAPGHSGSAPGQEKKTTAAPAAPAPAPAHTTHQSPGQAKKAASSSAPGVKPSSTTAKTYGKPTHYTIGQSGPDMSKRYGNGKTAAQIATSRGAPAGTVLTGPGNSQPHKVSVCGKPSNPSGGVDVHAVKSYDASACTQQKTAAPAVPQTSVEQTCEATTITKTTQPVLGVMHVNGQGIPVHLMTNPHSAHFTKHANDQVVLGAPVTETEVVPTGANCAAAAAAAAVAPQQPATAATQPAQQSPQTEQGAPEAATQVPFTSALPATEGMPVAAAQPAAGGVLGVTATLAKPASHGGVLGTIGRIAGGSLPFTGFPLWAAVLLAAGLVAAGVTLRRRSAPQRLQ